MPTALAADERPAASPGDLTHSAHGAWRGTSGFDLVDQFTDLAYAAEAAARRTARAA